MKKFLTITLLVLLTVGLFVSCNANAVETVFNEKIKGSSFKAVYNTTEGANTLTFYYDAVDHKGDNSNITVYDNLPTAATNSDAWGYNSIRDSVKSVVIDSSAADYHSLTSTAYMFQGMENAGSISGTEYLDTSNVTDMTDMFNGCKALAKLDISNFNTASVTTMVNMFKDCSNLKSVKITENAKVAEQLGNGWTYDNVNGAYARWGVTGNIASEGFAWSDEVDIVMTETATNVFVSPVITLQPSDEFKIRLGGDWAKNYGTSDSIILGEAVTVEQDGENMKVSAGGNYIITLDLTSKDATITVTAQAPETKNLSDILPSGFPTSDESAWVNADGKKAYKDGDNIKVGNLTLGKDVTVTKSGDNYVCTSGDATVTFNVMDETAESITVTDSSDSSGTYAPPVSVTGVTLDKTEVTIEVGDADVKLTATVIPDNATDKDVTWSSDKEGVATVDNEGKVHAVAAGETTITVTTVDGNKTASCEVKVTAAPTFKAVYDTTGNANTLTFYYDAVDHKGDNSNITVYDNLPTAATNSDAWGYNSIRDSVKSVVIDSSVANYDGLTSTAYMFQGMKNAGSINGEENLDVSNVTNMVAMFMNFGSSITTLNAVPNVANWNTEKVTDMSYIFQNYGNGSTALNAVPNVANWNTAKVTNMSNMFINYGSKSTVLNAVPNVANWNTANVTNMSNMFSSYGSTSEVLDKVPDVSNWKTDNVTNMSCMFNYYGCSNTGSDIILGSKVLDEVPNVANWNTTNVTDMSYMFRGYGRASTALSKVPDVSKWNTGNVTNMNQMFYDYGLKSTALNFTLDLSGWSVASVTKGSEMFSDAGAAASNWSVTISAKTGNQANDTTHWYVGDGTGTEKYIEPASGKQFTVKITIADVLATAGDNAPSTAKHWSGSNTSCTAYVNNGTLNFTDKYGTDALGRDTSERVSPDGDNNYCFTDEDGTITFMMTNGELTSMIVLYEEDFYSCNDTYTAPTTYTVTFDLKGITGTAPTAQQVVENGKVTKPEFKAPEGYALAGWYKDSDCTTEWNFDTDTVKDDTTLYAKWTPVPFKFVAEEANASVKLVKYGSPTNDILLEYSTDGVNFEDYEIGTEIQAKNVGDKVYFKAKKTNGSFAKGKEGEDNTNIEVNGNYQFVIPKKMSCSGNIMYLLDSTGTKTDVPEYAFAYLFGGTEITTAPELPATELAIGCYYNMFSSCLELTTAPELPAETLAEYCYNNMFVNCEYLTTAPALPAKTLAKSCYAYMFTNCSYDLTTAPALPATTLAERCYAGMFRNCYALTTAPALPAETLVESCYENMFENCQELTTAPALPATTLAKRCYAYMFENCSNLTTAPDLPATELKIECYYGMFDGCSLLNSVTMLATDISANNCLSYWLSGVAGTGTIYIDSTQTEKLKAGSKGIPSGWNVVANI